MAGLIGCQGLNVRGEGGDSVIRISNDIINADITFQDPEEITNVISQSVSVIVV